MIINGVLQLHCIENKHQHLSDYSVFSNDPYPENKFVSFMVSVAIKGICLYGYGSFKIFRAYSLDQLL